MLLFNLHKTLSQHLPSQVSTPGTTPDRAEKMTHVLVRELLYLLIIICFFLFKSFACLFLNTVLFLLRVYDCYRIQELLKFALRYDLLINVPHVCSHQAKR